MDFFGLDIGSHNIKIIELNRRGGKYFLSAFGSGPSTIKGLLSEAESDLVALAEAIKKLLRETGIRTRNVVSALPQDQVFTRLVTLPPLSEEELNSAIKWEAEQYIPLSLEEVILTHEIIGKKKEDSKEKLEVLLAAAPKNLVEKTLKVLQLAGLNPLSLEMEMTAIARSLVSPGYPSVLLVDLGAKATDLAVVENGQVVLIHSIPTAGEALTRAISFELGLETSQAEAYKKAYGADIKKLEGKVSAALNPILEVILKEIEKLIKFSQTERKEIQGVILTGGTAIMPEMTGFLAKKLGLEVQVGNPFGQIVEDEMVKRVPQTDLPFYSVAVGLAMKEM